MTFSAFHHWQMQAVTLTVAIVLQMTAAQTTVAQTAVAQTAIAQPVADSPTAAVTPGEISSLNQADEQVALQFAETHYAELAELLLQLKAAKPPAYGRAIMEVHSAAARIGPLKEKQPARYKHQLAIWKRNAEIRLLLARWSISQEHSLEKRIRKLLREREVSRIQQLRAEQMDLQERLDVVTGHLAQGKENLDLNVTTEWLRLATRATAAERANRQAAKDEPDKQPADTE